MQLTNTRNSYGWLAIALHWIVVIVIAAMLTTGFQAESAGEAGDRAARGALMGLHISIGATFALVLLARVLSSYLQPRPAALEQKQPFKFLASSTHQLLLLGILIQVISGPLAVWSGGRAINVFDVFAIPSPFAARNQGVHEIAELLHAIGRWMLIVLISLHVLATLKHVFVDRDGVLRRMLAPAKG